MLYIVFEKHTGELVAYIDTETGQTQVERGYILQKADIKDVFIKRPGEEDFPDMLHEEHVKLNKLLDQLKRKRNADTDIQQTE